MRLAPRLKTRLDSLVKTRLSSVIERYFARNSSTRYATIPAVTLARDFVIEVDISTTDGDHNLLTGAYAAPAFRLAIYNDTIRVDVDGGQKASFDIAGIDLTLFHKLVLTRVNGDFSCSLSGVNLTPIITTGFSSIINISYIYNKFNGSGIPIFKGVLANLKIWDNGTLVRNYPINDNSSTIRDLANGQDGTIINGNASDWGLFDKQANGDWLGNSLAVPPWDSIDQVLVKA
tara:strand:+ start:6119 stop:6814 length:696 start_codon:yes stop_codon:yes gene_type:complete